MKNLYIIILFFACGIFTSHGQNFSWKPKKIGFLYNYGTEENFIYNDPDYYYQTNTIKAQAFYDLGKWKSLDFELIVQPQLQFLRHKLHNIQFVRPDTNDFEEKRIRFSKLKSMKLYAFELGFAVKKQILKKLDGLFILGLGIASINTETERLAKGFTFIENFSFGFSYNFVKKTTLYVGTNYGHVSNLSFQHPNDGYNNLGIELGLQYALH